MSLDVFDTMRSGKSLDMQSPNKVIVYGILMIKAGSWLEKRERYLERRSSYKGMYLCSISEGG
jgi:hypothetical protein